MDQNMDLGKENFSDFKEYESFSAIKSRQTEDTIDSC